MITNHTTHIAIKDAHLDITFDRPLTCESDDSGEAALLYMYIVEELNLGVDGYDEHFTMLYGAKWAIVGVRAMNAETFDLVQGGVAKWLAVAND
jgi:hypothetical protein